jgi:hypothetical protein
MPASHDREPVNSESCGPPCSIRGLARRREARTRRPLSAGNGRYGLTASRALMARTPLSWVLPSRRASVNNSTTSSKSEERVLTIGCGYSSSSSSVFTHWWSGIHFDSFPAGQEAMVPLMHTSIP